MPFELNSAQEIFGIFYAIFFGIMVETTGWLNSFPTHEAIRFGFGSKASRRLVVSVVTLNVIPLLYFVFCFVQLSHLEIQSPMNIIDFIKVFSVALLSLTVFGFYRIHTGVMVLGWRRFYRQSLWKKIRNDRVENYKEAEILGCIEIDGKICNRTVWDEWLNHFVPGLCYLPVCILPFLVATLNPLGLALDLVLIFLIYGIWRALRN